MPQNPFLSQLKSPLNFDLSCFLSQKIKVLGFKRQKTTKMQKNKQRVTFECFFILHSKVRYTVQVQ